MSGTGWGRTSRDTTFLLLSQALKALENISCCCYYCDGSETGNKKVNSGNLKMLEEPERSLDIGWKGRRGESNVTWAFCPDYSEWWEAGRVKAVFTERPRVLEDTVESGRRAEGEVELDLGSPHGECPLGMWRPREIFKSGNFRTDSLFLHLCFLPSHCPQTQGYNSSIFHFRLSLIP